MADFNQLAARLVRSATDEGEPKAESARVRAARAGGAKGGAARASKLSPERRTQIARRAAQARWSARQEDE